MVRIISISILLFVSCSSPSTRNQGDTTKNQKVVTSPQQAPDDTLRNASHYSYLTDLPLRQVALLIMSDSISPSDNLITFDCMDSISADDADTRAFYFPVFKKIVEKSDGALAEVVGQYIMKYIERFPKEFIIKTKSFKNHQFLDWASHVGYELNFIYDTPKKAEGWMNTIIFKCSTCDSSYIRGLKDFDKLCIEAMKESDDD